MEAKREMEQQDMGAVEDRQQQQQQHGEEEQLVEVKTDPPRRCPHCSSVDTMFGYYSNNCDNQPSYRCKTCNHYWIHGEFPRNISVGYKRKTDVSEAPSASTNCVCKVPRLGGNPIRTSCSSTRTNRQHDPISRILAAEEDEFSNPISLMRINEPRTSHTTPLDPVRQSVPSNTIGSGLLSSISAGVNQHLHPHGLHQQPQQQQQLSDSQNFWWNGGISQMPSVDQIPVPSVLPSITPLELPQGVYNENNAVGLEPVSLTGNTWMHNTNVSVLQSEVTHIVHSTTVTVFQQSIYSVSSLSDQSPVFSVLPSINPLELPQGLSLGNNFSLGMEADAWNTNCWQNSNSIGEFQGQVTPVQNSTTVPPFQQSLDNCGDVFDIEDVLWTNNSLNNSSESGSFL